MLTSCQGSEPDEHVQHRLSQTHDNSYQQWSIRYLSNKFRPQNHFKAHRYGSRPQSPYALFTPSRARDPPQAFQRSPISRRQRFQSEECHAPALVGNHQIGYCAAKRRNLLIGILQQGRRLPDSPIQLSLHEANIHTVVIVQVEALTADVVGQYDRSSLEFRMEPPFTRNVEIVPVVHCKAVLWIQFAKGDLKLSHSWRA